MLQCKKCKRCLPARSYVKLMYDAKAKWFVLDKYKLCVCCRRPSSRALLGAAQQEAGAEGRDPAVLAIAKIWKSMKREALYNQNYSSHYICEIYGMKVLPNSKSGHEQTQRHVMMLDAFDQGIRLAREQSNREHSAQNVLEEEWYECAESSSPPRAQHGEGHETWV